MTHHAMAFQQDPEWWELGKRLDVLTGRIDAINRANGWYDEGRTFGDGIALIHSEVSEALEAFRDHGFKTLLRFQSDDGYALLPPEDSNAQRWMESGTIPKPEGVASEMADIIIRVLDECSRQNLDITDALRTKLAYNETRGYKHGGKSL